jgi:hypothetical protein
MSSSVGLEHTVTDGVGVDGGHTGLREKPTHHTLSRRQAATEYPEPLLSHDVGGR